MRRARHADDRVTTAPVASGTAPDPADRVTLDDSIRMALLVVLQQLTPAERAVFVLHDVFQFSFEAISSIVERTPAACRQIASRARRRIEAETGPHRFEPDLAEQQRVAQRLHRGLRGRRSRRAGRAARSGRRRQGRPRHQRQEPSPLHGRAAIAPNLLRFFGPRPSDPRVATDQRQSRRPRVPQPPTRHRAADRTRVPA